MDFGIGSVSIQVPLVDVEKAARQALFITTGVAHSDLTSDTPLPEDLRSFALHFDLALHSVEFPRLIESGAKTFGQLIEELKARR